MENRQILRLPVRDLDWYEDVLRQNRPHPDFSRGETIECWSGRFEDGMVADINLCNGDPSPWVDAIIFDREGHEVAVLEPSFILAGEYKFDETHIVEVCAWTPGQEEV